MKFNISTKDGPRILVARVSIVRDGDLLLYNESDICIASFARGYWYEMLPYNMEDEK